MRMRSPFRFPLALAVLTLGLSVAIFAAGCGDDDDNGGGGNGPDNPVIDVRNGEWRIVTTATLSGEAGSCTGTETDIDTSLVCDIDFSDTNQPLPFDITCEVTQTGPDFTFSCTGVFNFPPCVITFTNSGSGTTTDTTVTFTSTVLFDVAGPDNPCLQYDQPCTTLVDVTAQWIAPDEDNLCGDEGSKPTPLVLKSLVERAAGRALEAHR